jgi:hypothetical protein
MTKKRSNGILNGILLAISIAALLGIFAIGMTLVTEHVEIEPIGEENGRLELIPTVSVTNNNTVTMKLKYIPIRKNINPLEYIYEHNESAICNTNHTQLYKLSLNSTNNQTRVYKIEKIVSGTFIRIVRLSDGLLKNLTVSNGIIYEGTGFSFEVKTDAGNVYLYLTQTQKTEIEDTKT